MTVAVRAATPGDIGDLAGIEEISFNTDRISRRQFRYLLRRARATTLVATDDDGPPLGYATVLYRRGSPLARLYSIAVRPDRRGEGIAAVLVGAAEAAALARGATRMRLEVRADDSGTQQFYLREGYRRLGMRPNYYEDDGDAVRMEKQLTLSPDLGLAARAPR